MRPVPIGGLGADAKSSSLTAALADGVVDRRRVRRLELQGFVDAEFARVVMFLRVGCDRLRCKWEIGFGGELDLLVFCGDSPDTVRGLLSGPSATLSVVDHDGDRRNEGATLVRPLQYESFVDVLTKLEHRLDSSVDVATRDTGAGEATAIATDDSYRLRRWPPSGLLQEHLYHLRLASCMSVRHVGIEELVRLTNVSRPHCIQFLATLATHNLLDVRPLVVTAAQLPMNAASTREGPASRRSNVDSGLFGQIRRRLGLTLKR